MKKILFILIIALVFVGCNKKKGCMDPAATNYDSNANQDDGSCDFLRYPGNGVTDIDSNVYETVIIGNQEWMAENLKTTKYANGDTIPIETNNTNWSNLSTDAYCWYDNDSTTYDSIYGKLYNWYTIADSSNVCPTGWHVPSDEDWTQLINFLDASADTGATIQSSIAGGGMKETGVTYWTSPNSGATNSNGFSGLPGGFRSYNGDFGAGSINRFGYWWTSSEKDTAVAWIRKLYYNSNNVGRSYSYKIHGFSVRCVKD